MELRELGEKSRMGVRGGDFILKIRTSTGSGRARVKVARRAHAGLGVGGRCPMDVPAPRPRDLSFSVKYGYALPFTSIVITNHACRISQECFGSY